MNVTVIYTASQQLQNITAVGKVTVYRLDNPKGVGRFPAELRSFP
jgi:hypothetical protein